MSAWMELRVIIPRTRMSALSDLAFALGATGVEEAEAPGSRRQYRQPWDTEDPPLPMFCCFKTWFSEEEAPAAAKALGELASAEVELLEVREEDWEDSWKQHHHRIAISERLRVAPPWEAVPGDLVIPPGNAFGTGDHPTTLACLGAIDRLADQCHSCLDVGCGSGVLALAAASLGLKAQGIDIEPEAVKSAQENAHLNGLQAHFSGQGLETVQGNFDLVVCNLYAEVLVMLAPELLRLTQRHLVLAGILAEKADRVIEALSPPLAVVERIQDGEWVSLHLERL